MKIPRTRRIIILSYHYGVLIRIVLILLIERDHGIIYSSWSSCTVAIKIELWKQIRFTNAPWQGLPGFETSRRYKRMELEKSTITRETESQTTTLTTTASQTQDHGGMRLLLRTTEECDCIFSSTMDLEMVECRPLPGSVSITSDLRNTSVTVLMRTQLEQCLALQEV